MDLTIIIPVYNLQNVVIDTLKSIEEQATSYSIEAIIVDDGSTDQTVEIIKQFILSSDNKVFSLIENSHNKGVAGARNSGIEASTGKWISFLDGDDLLVAGAVQTKLDIAFSHQEVEVISHGFIRWYEKADKFLSERTYNQNLAKMLQSSSDIMTFDDPLSAYIKCQSLICTDTIMIKSEAAKKVGLFRYDLKLGEDTNYWMRVLRNAKKLIYINQDLCLYRSREGSLTGQGEPGSLYSAIYLEEMLQDSLYQDYHPLLKTCLVKNLLSNAYYFRMQRQYVLAQQTCQRILQLSPWSLKAWKGLLAATLKR